MLSIVGEKAAWSCVTRRVNGLYLLPAIYSIMLKRSIIYHARTGRDVLHHSLAPWRAPLFRVTVNVKSKVRAFLLCGCGLCSCSRVQPIAVVRVCVCVFYLKCCVYVMYACMRLFVFVLLVLPNICYVCMHVCVCCIRTACTMDAPCEATQSSQAREGFSATVKLIDQSIAPSRWKTVETVGIGACKSRRDPTGSPPPPPPSPKKKCRKGRGRFLKS